MKVNLKQANVDDLARAVFHHPPAEAPNDPWYFGDVTFEIEPEHQIKLLTQLFHGAPAHFRDYTERQIEEGLWCMMGGVHYDAFCGLVWQATLPLQERLKVVDSIYVLYDHVLANYPYEVIDFEHPDAEPRRFQVIDYMVPDLLLMPRGLVTPIPADVLAVEAALFALFEQLIHHPALVAQYAGLHGLGHLEHPGRSAAIDRYLDGVTWPEPGQREYAEAARRGDVL